MKKFLFFLIFIFAFAQPDTNAQFKSYKIKGGLKYEQLIPLSEYNASYSFLGKGFLGFELTPALCLQVEAGYGQFKTEDNYNRLNGTYDSNTDTEGNNLQGTKVKSNLIPIDIILKISPWSKTAKNWNPYFYFGGGATYYSTDNSPYSTFSKNYVSEDKSGWAGIFPAGVGTEVRLSDNVLLDFNMGAMYTTTDLLNHFVVPDFNDATANVGLGITFGNFKPGVYDTDKDGLTDEYEQKTCTDYKNPDTDVDGLKDGAEVNQYKTNPCNKDSDGDQLNDGDEVIKYSTNPLNKDTDSDKLTDYDELMKYSTLPKDSDTDDDSLIDGDEVLTYKTNPKIADTDLGSIGDGVEVKRGTDPLNPSDDLPPVKEEPMKVGAVIILEGINFASGSYAISAGSDDILEKAYATMHDHPEIFVEISGHTDSRGGYNMNMTLSKNRAEAVKEWLVSRGIDGSRIETVGYGPDNPIASNDTEEGRYKNRRIEFKRVK